MDNLQQRVEENVLWLSNIGGTNSGGTTRLLYDNQWCRAQKELKERFEQMGLITSYDEIGNLFGRLEGSKYPNETIMSGSHVDTVIEGGKLDGQFGVVAAYLAIDYLKNKYGQPLRSLEVVSLAEEEGSRFPYAFWGSKNLWGLADSKDVLDVKDVDGMSFFEAMQRAGFGFKKSKDIRTDIKSFIELHIEQGNVLETLKKPLGVVTSIVGQKRYTVTLEGEANHAGTTPMGYRKDAMYGYSQIVSQTIDYAKTLGDPLVVTFGEVELVPNTVNVVPGKVMFTIDCRHTDEQLLTLFTNDMTSMMKKIAQENNLNINISLWMTEKPVLMDESLVNIIKSACDESDLDYQVMHSGAGHDSQIFASFVPTAMIFVPSIKGISHNPAEATDICDLTQGVKALIATLYQLAYKE